MSQNKTLIDISHIGVKLFKKKGILGRKSTYHWALKDVTFSVQEGEVLGVIGRNGAGKSTLLRVLAAIFNPDTGKIRRYGNRACLLALQAGFISELSGRENALLSGMLLGFKKRDVLNRMDEIHDFSELEDWFEQPVTTYSSGMRARLGFSVAINLPTDIILVDETLGVGDTGFKQKSTAAMKDIMKSERTVILVSHSADLVRELSDRVLWIENGKNVMIGSPDEVCEKYEEFWQDVIKLKATGIVQHEAVLKTLKSHNLSS